ncbi:PspC domain-containing protein [Solirubrobacter soli]|uniref:PspC domain-containing protein n=1 Tax=Solirubrobacter soli TaxID=363832 RepID=UPI00040E996B|nr:PspC domain-containing protein [Solirubrobacter soli]
MNDVPAPTTRARSGRWLGGVCAGLAERWGVPVGRVRLGFVLASVVLGLGVLVYLAAWLILPEDGVDGGQRGIVLVAQAIGGLLGLAALAAAGAAATMFGYGWAVVAVACAVLVGVLAGWARLGPAWALLPIGALVLPSVAMAVGGVRIDPSTSTKVLAPGTTAELPRGVVRSGFGLLTVDLRRTELPASGTIPLRIEAGPRRTLIALPHDRCVHVVVNQHEAPPALRLGGALVGRYGQVGPQVFGERRPPHYATPRDRPGPVLAVDFSSVGGSLVVRDYPNDMNPDDFPDWPGYPVFGEPRPDTTGVARAEALTMLHDWHARRNVQVRDKKRIDRLMGGPCTAKR